MSDPTDPDGPGAAGDVPERREDDTLRVSDHDRDLVVEQLGEHASAGRLTLAEHEERMALALRAKTRGELQRLLADLPAPTAAEPARRRKVTRWIVSALGGTDRTGRWRVGGRLNTVTVMGGCDVDLRNAEFDEPELTITAVTVMGGTNIYVPDSVDLEVRGFSLMGGRSERGSTRRPRPGAPRVVIHSYNLMGGSEIYRLPDETRELPGPRAARDLRRDHRHRGH